MKGILERPTYRSNLNAFVALSRGDQMHLRNQCWRFILSLEFQGTFGKHSKIAYRSRSLNVPGNGPRDILLSFSARVRAKLLAGMNWKFRIKENRSNFPWLVQADRL